jgi:tagatose 6-phosphate kinase
LILTVTLNAAVDKTYRVENFALDRVNRPSDWRIVAGGKGINVARVYQTLGGRAIATGFLGGYNGRFIAEALRQEGIAARFVRTREESRVCIAAVDPVSRTQTEINESGPNVMPGEVASLKRVFRRLLQEYDFQFVTLSGSLPPGVPDAIYADLLLLAREAGARGALDASGPALAAGLEQRPWLVKPNVFELSDLVGRELVERDEITEAAREIVRTGVEIVCVTMGRHGGLCVMAEGMWQAAPPPIRFVSAVGSGDSLLAAFVWAMEQGQHVEKAFRLGIGAGAANAEVYGAGFCTAEEIR